MIKIPITENQKEEMEKIYWAWMKRYHLAAFENMVRNDASFYDLIMQGQTDLTEAVKAFLFSDAEKLRELKSKIDGGAGGIRSSTKDFLLARYKNYRDSQAAKIVRLLDITVCPYCNQNHINFVYDKKGKAKMWGDLDHFFDKSTYPQFAVCLYNLIPVCKVCNQLKSSQAGNFTSPFGKNGKSHLVFATDFDEKKDLDYLWGKSDHFQIIIDKACLTMEDKEEIRLFDLENRYKDLKRNAQEIIIKSRAYHGIYGKQLRDLFQIGEEELEQYIFGYTDNHRNRALSKFNYDIMQEFKNPGFLPS